MTLAKLLFKIFIKQSITIETFELRQNLLGPDLVNSLFFAEQVNNYPRSLTADGLKRTVIEEQTREK